MSAVVNVIEKVGGAAVDVVDWAVDEIVAPVVDTVGTVIEAALDDPVKTIAQVAAVATGNAWALPLIEGADVVIAGGDIEDVLEATAKAYVAQQVGSYVGKAAGTAASKAGAAAEYGVSAGSQQAAALAAQNAGMLTAGDIAGRVIGSASGSAAAAIVVGVDPVKAFVSGGIGAGVPAVLGSVEGFSELPPAAQNAIAQGVTAQLTGRDPTVALINAAVQSTGIVTEIIKSYDPDGTKLTDAQRAIAADILMGSTVAALSGGDVNQAIQKAIIVNGQKALAQMIDEGFKKAESGVSDAYKKAENAAAAVAANEDAQKASVNNYNTTVNELNARVAKQDALKAAYDKSLATFNGSKTEANANATNKAAKAYNDYVEALNKDYAEKYEPDITRYAAELAQIQNDYGNLNDFYSSTLEEFSTAADGLKEKIQPAIDSSNKAFVEAMSPSFDVAAYKKINGIQDDVEAYEHWLTKGQFEGLIVNNTDYQTALEAVDLLIADPSMDEGDLMEMLDRYKLPQQAAMEGLGLNEEQFAAVVSQLDSRVTTDDEAVQLYRDIYGSDPEPSDVSAFVGLTESDVSEVLSGRKQVEQDSANRQSENSQQWASSTLSALEEQGYSPSQIEDMLSDGTLEEYAGQYKSAIESNISSLELEAQRAYKDYGADSEEYRGAATAVLDAKADAGLGVSKSADGTYNTEAGALDPNTLKPKVIPNSYIDPATGYTHVYNSTGPISEAGVDVGSGMSTTIYHSGDAPERLVSAEIVLPDGRNLSDINNILAIGESANPPNVDKGALFGDGSGSSSGYGGGFKPIAIDDGNGNSVYGNDNGYSIVVFSDGRTAVAPPNEPLTWIDLTEPEKRQVEQPTPPKAPEEVKDSVAQEITKTLDDNLVTKDEFVEALSDSGYFNPTDEELNQLAQQITTQSDLDAQLPSYVDDRTVSEQEVRDAYAALGLDSPSSSDIQELIGQYAEADLALKAEESLPKARFNSLQDQLDAANSQLGTSGRSVTQDDIDFVNQIIAGNQEADLAYDTNQDGAINQEDIDFLSGILSGDNADWQPQEGSIWGPTGMYGEIIRLGQQQGESDRAAAAAAAAAAEQQAAYQRAASEQQAAYQRQLRTVQLQGQARQIMQPMRQQLVSAENSKPEINPFYSGEINPFIVGQPFSSTALKKPGSQTKATGIKMAQGGYIDQMDNTTFEEILHMLRNGG